MGYERDTRRFSSDDNRYNRHGSDRGNEARYGRPDGDRDDRGFFDRAGDEVRSWFGDEEAERRRRYDERDEERHGSDRDRDDRLRNYNGQPAGGQGGRPGARSYGDQDRGQSFGQRDRGRDTAGYGWGGATSQSDGRSSDQGSRQSPHDENYRSWRDRQIEALDRDYHDYRRENQSKFETEFSGYRTQRQGQRDLLGKVQEHQEVVGSDGQHVGKVDHVRGDRIKLAKNDQAAGGHHHSIPSSWIQSVDERVTISKTAEEAKRAWRDEDEGDNGGGLFGQRKDNREEGRTNLNRSFSGTY